MSNHYETLGIEKTAGRDDIKTAYRGLASKYHTGAGGGDHDKMQAIQEAYDVLYNPAKREFYDEFGIEPTGDELADQEAYGVIKESFLQLLQQGIDPYRPYVEEMRMVLNGYINQFNSNIEALQKEQELLLEMIDTVRENDENPIMRKVIQDGLERGKAMEGQAAERKDQCERALKLLENSVVGRVRIEGETIQ